MLELVIFNQIDHLVCVHQSIKMIDYDSLALTQIVNGGQDGRLGHVMSHQVPGVVPVKIEVAGTTDG